MKYAIGFGHHGFGFSEINSRVGGPNGGSFVGSVFEGRHGFSETKVERAGWRGIVLLVKCKQSQCCYCLYTLAIYGQIQWSLYRCMSLLYIVCVHVCIVLPSRLHFLCLIWRVSSTAREQVEHCCWQPHNEVLSSH